MYTKPLYVWYATVSSMRACKLSRLSHAINVLMTFCIIWPHPGHGALNLCNLRAQGKQVIMWPVRPWMMLPLRGRTRHSLQGSSMASGWHSVSMYRASWLSPSELSCEWLICEGPFPLDEEVDDGGRFLETWCDGRTTGSDTVLWQSGMSIPSSSSSSSSSSSLWGCEAQAVMSGTEMECTRRGQSLYQSFRRAQQRMQYLWSGVLNLRHSEHCHESCEMRTCQIFRQNWFFNLQ